MDIAVLKINRASGAPSFPYLALGSSADVRVGEFVLALGSPQGFQNTVTSGIVSCLYRHASELGLSDRRAAYLQTDAPISFGNSGGPLINIRGEVIGINTVAVPSLGQLGFAIPIDVVKEAMRELVEHGKVRRPFVGERPLFIPVISHFSRVIRHDPTGSHHRQSSIRCAALVSTNTERYP